MRGVLLYEIDYRAKKVPLEKAKVYFMKKGMIYSDKCGQSSHFIAVLDELKAFIVNQICTSDHVSSPTVPLLGLLFISLKHI